MASLEAKRKRSAEMPKGRFQNRSSIFFKPPNLSSDRPFSTHKRDFMRFSGSGLRFRSAISDANIRNLVKKCEIEAHFFFENWQFSTNNCENWWNWVALLICKLTIFDEHLWKFVKISERRTSYLKINTSRRNFVKLRCIPFLKTCNFRRKLVKICEIGAHFCFENWQFSTRSSENWSNFVKMRRTSFAPRAARGFLIRWLETSSLSVRPASVRPSVRLNPIS